MENISFDELYMTLAYTIALKSKDRSTKFGCVVVDDSNTVRSLGYNNFPQGFDDDLEEAHTRPLKYKYTEHAERNAFYNASRIGVSLDGCRLYIPGCPCSDCARGTIRTGIKEVIVHKEWIELGGWKQWEEDSKHSRFMFDKCGVSLRFFEGRILPLKMYRDEKEYDLNKELGPTWVRIEENIKIDSKVGTI